MMYNVVIFIEDHLRGKIVRLQVDLDRRVDALIEWYVAHYGLPRRDFDLDDIEYRLLRAVDKRALARKKTLREAGVTKGDLLQLRGRKGRPVWRTVEAVLDEIEKEARGRIVDEVWDRVAEKLTKIEATETDGCRVQQVRRLIDKSHPPAKLIDIGDKLGEALDISRAARAWAKRGLAAMTVGGSSILVTGALVLGNLIAGPECGPVPPGLTESIVVSATPAQTAAPSITPTSTPTATATQTPSATPTPTLTPTHTPTPFPTITRTPIPRCFPQRPDGWAAYIVRRGDTLFSLARSTSTTVAVIQRVNCLPNSIIREGERLWLPAVPKLVPTTRTPLRPPDLIVTKVSGLRESCSDALDGCVTWVRFSIANTGDVSAGGFIIRVAADPAQSVIVNLRSPGLAPGAAREFTTTTPVGDNCHDPDCTVCVIVDSQNNVIESNEKNNVLCATSTGVKLLDAIQLP